MKNELTIKCNAIMKLIDMMQNQANSKLVLHPLYEMWKFCVDLRIRELFKEKPSDKALFVWVGFPYMKYHYMDMYLTHSDNVYFFSYKKDVISYKYPKFFDYVTEIISSQD